jgi:hypothetical protein
VTYNFFLLGTGDDFMTFLFSYLHIFSRNIFSGCTSQGQRADSGIDFHSNLLGQVDPPVLNPALKVINDREEFY